VLDVGHGNCAIVQDGPELAVVDAPKTSVLPFCLEMQNDPTVRHLILSHADEDHIGGAQALLAHDNIRIRELWINPNSQQHSNTYRDLLTVARDRFLSQGLRVSTNLNVGAGENLSFGRVNIEILHPDIIYAGIGPTDSSHPHGRITSNGMSAVLRISLGGRPAVLLPGDMDAAAFNVLISAGTDISAPVLVFPHHGGSGGGGNDHELAARLCTAVRPELIVFSIGRRRYANPTPEVMAGIREAAPKAHVACTQLSKRCNTIDLDPRLFDHVLADVPAAGRPRGLSCAGSIVIDWSSDRITYRPLRAAHQLFIETHVATPLCAP
jgi:beta-lactamase superfamily II metal-dependent hydrolase